MTLAMENMPAQAVWGQARAIQAAQRALHHYLDLQRLSPQVQGSGISTDLTLQQLSTLLTIHESEPVSIRGLAKAQGVSAPSASVMVDRLVEMGLVTRQHSRQDRREVEVRVSSHALAQMEYSERQLLFSLAEILDKVGPEYAQMWSEVSVKLAEVLKKEGGHGA